MPKADYMTESDDKTRWILATVFFVVLEIEACVHAYKSIANGSRASALATAFGAAIVWMATKRGLSAILRLEQLKSDQNLRLTLSLRFWIVSVIALVMFQLVMTVPDVMRSLGF